jgi:CBS domain containing-hemolysin-like protein
MGILPALLATFLLVLANAFFVASEFAIVKIRPSRLEALAATGNRRARIALSVSRRLDAYLSANQLGITLASLALGWIGERTIARILQPLFGNAVAAHSVAITVSFFAITFLHTVLGELAPKSLAIQRTEPVALWTAAPLRAFYYVMFPVIWILNHSAQLVLRVVGLGPVGEAEKLHSPQELRMLLPHVAMDPGARLRREPADDAAQPVHPLSAGRERARARVCAHQGCDGRAGGGAAPADARAHAHADLRVRGHAARAAAS